MDASVWVINDVGQMAMLLSLDAEYQWKMKKQKDQNGVVLN